MKISVCIPAYNRSDVLGELLDSIIAQDYKFFDIVIVEDCSPQRNKIAEIVSKYQKKHPDLIQFFENEKNLGYDGNLRNLFEKATGEYCFFMGNDDLMYPNALSNVAKALESHDNIGVLLRSYASFAGTPDNIVQTFRYFDRKIFFPAGAPTITTVYRRSVVIPGMVINRKEALKYSTDRFDGTLLYQLYLVANILVDMNALFLPDILVLYRTGGIPDFGNNENETAFVPEDQTPESSLAFMEGMLKIAKYVDGNRNISIMHQIEKDLSNYSYPFIAIQSHKPFAIYMKYVHGLFKLGFGKSPLFYLYVGLTFFPGDKYVSKVFGLIKKVLGHTPSLGKIYKGVAD